MKVENKYASSVSPQLYVGGLYQPLPMVSVHVAQPPSAVMLSLPAYNLSKPQSRNFMIAGIFGFSKQLCYLRNRGSFLEFRF